MNKLQRLERIESDVNLILEEARLLRAEIEAEQTKEAEWPKVGDVIYYIDEHGILSYGSYDGTDKYNRIIAYGNGFADKKEAQRIANYRKDPVAQAREKLAAFAYEYNGLEWYNKGEFIHLDFNGNIEQGWSDGELPEAGLILFKDSHGPQAAIDALGNDLIKLACGVKK